MNWFMHHPVLLGLVGAGVAVGYGLYLTYWLLQQPAGNDRMREISRAVQEGAAAYLRKQYTAIAIVAIVPFLALGFYDKLGWGTAFGFLIGAILSSAAGFIGMNVAVRSNSRTAEAARNGLKPALNVAFRAGSVTGLLVVGLGLLGVTGYYWFLTAGLNHTPHSAITDLVGLAFGGSLISVFARLGGGIFTKAADVGADLVGKIEAGIPEDDPRNPAVIADNVGDNVGDCAGMAADLFETYAVTAVAVMLLGTAAHLTDARLYLFPLALGAVSAVSSVIGTFFARLGRGENAVINALYKAVLVATLLSAAGFIPITMAFDGHGGYDFTDLYVSAVVGLVITFLLVAITEFYTGTRWNPVKAIAKASQTGPRDEHHRRARDRHAGDRAAGDRDRGRHPRRPSLRRALRDRRRRDGAALDDRSHRRARRVRPGDRQRGRDRRDGRPAGRGARDHRPARRRRQHDEGGHEGLRDRLRRARRARPLRVLHLGPARPVEDRERPAHDPVQPLRSVGDRRSLHRRPDAVPLRLARDAGGRPGRRRGRRRRCAASSASTPGIMDYTERPDYSQAVGIVTTSAIRSMLLPALIPIGFPIIVGIINPRMLGGLLIGTIVTGLFLAISMTSGGGAWDNAKKSIEDGLYGGKGSEAHAASVTGDTVGDPYKDTAGPAINPMIKIANIVAILIIPLIVSIHG